ncbi:MAG: hypothetical protein LUP97_05380 [Methanoregula sp.]|jgi:hypothetical protein|nr:hypothetical protein [Methanoregula sp.]
MLCWRDLTQKCAEEDCPMWMTRFDLSDVIEPEELGLNENKCAHVFNEKLGVMKTMIDMLESMRSTSDLFPEDLRYGLEPGTKNPGGPANRTLKAAKKPRTPAKTPR